MRRHRLRTAPDADSGATSTLSARIYGMKRPYPGFSDHVGLNAAVVIMIFSGVTLYWVFRRWDWVRTGSDAIGMLRTRPGRPEGRRTSGHSYRDRSIVRFQCVTKCLPCALKFIAPCCYVATLTVIGAFL